MAEAGAGNQPAAGTGVETAAAAAVEAEAGNKARLEEGKKKKMVRVKQEYIDRLLARRPIKPFPYIPEERIQLMNPKRQEETRARQARMSAIIKVIHDEEEDILEQYRVKGYAEQEVEVEEGVDRHGKLGSPGDRFERKE